jgi:putative ABC transport system ATP-binding protein
MTTPNDHVLRVRGLTRVYTVGRTEVHALQGIDVEVRRGEMFAIRVPRLRRRRCCTCGCLDRPTSGTYELDGIRVDTLGANAPADVRNRKIGFVFQGFNLLARTSALDNVELPLLYDRSGASLDTRARAAHALEQVGLADRMDHQPSELSGGQQQRVAIARALVTRPALLLADEPTGALDSRTTVEIMELFQTLNEQGNTVLIVTHEHDVSRHARRIVELCDGRVIHDEPVLDRLIAGRALARKEVA